MGQKASKKGGDPGASASSAAHSTSPASQATQPNSVIVNVYEPREPSMMGGVYHSGIEIYDTEYMYGAGNSSLTGISSHRPRQTLDPQWVFLKSEHLGTTSLSRAEIRTMINELKQGSDWPSNAYSVTGKNCNHFSEAVTKKLGLTFPSYINRAAKIANTVGLGSKKGQPSGPVDLDGNPLRESDTRALVMETVVDVCVDSLLDLKKVAMLGGKSSSTLTSIIPVDAATGARTKLRTDAAIESDTDEQLLLFLPFKQPVKLLSFLVRLSVKDPSVNPKTVAIFCNHPNLDFSDADSTTPTLEVEFPSKLDRAFTKEELKEGVFEYVVQLPMAKFAACTFLTLFVKDNHGAPHTKLAGLTLVGRDK